MDALTVWPLCSMPGVREFLKGSDPRFNQNEADRTHTHCRLPAPGVT